MQGFSVPDSDRIQPPGQGGPVIRQLTPPVPGAGKTTYSPLSADDVKSLGLPPGSYQRSSEGKIEKVADVPGGPAALTAEDRGKFTRQRQGALGLQSRIKEVENLYNQNFKGGGAGALIEYAPGFVRPENKVFENAGGALMGDLAAAYGLTAQQQNTPTELEIRFGPYIPKPGDRDEVIEAKIRRLKEVAAEQERQALDALGVTQDDQALAGAPMPAQSVPVPPAPGDLPPPEPPLNPSANGFESVVDPKQQALAGTINGLILKGADRTTILRAAIAGGMNKDDPKFLQFAREIDGAIRYRKSPDFQKFQRVSKGPVNFVGPEFYTFDRPMSGGEQLLNDAAQSPVGSFAAGAADTLTGGTLDNIIGMTGGDAENARRSQEMIAQENPMANFAGNIVGGSLAGLGGEAALARLGMGPGAGRALLADSGFGAAYGAGSADDGNRLQGAALGAAAGAGGNLIGRGATNTLGRLTAGVSDPAVRELVKENIPLTIGQALGKSKGIVGKTVKGLEDRFAGFSAVGDAINSRRTEGLEAFNAKAFDKALEPINKTVGNLTGEEAVAQAQDHVSSAFSDALKGKSASVDRRFITESAKAKNAIEDLGPSLEPEINKSIDLAINDYFDDGGKISGENMQALLQELGTIKRGYQMHPLSHRVNKAVNLVEQSIENLFMRQAPDVMPKYNAAKQAFRKLSILEDSVNRGVNTEGKFTPAQLGMANRANTIKYQGKGAAAAGKGPLHDFQRTAQEVLPNKVPDAGTAGRVAALAVPAAVASSGAGVGYAAGDAQSGAGVGLGLAGLIALAYSKGGQRVLVNAMTKRGAKARAAGRAIKERARLTGSAAATAGVLGTSPDR